MRYTGADEEEDDEDKPTRKIEALNNRTDQLGWPLTLFAPKYLTGTESGLQVWLIVTSAATLPMLHWMSNMKERDTGKIAPGQGLVIKSHNVVIAIRWPIK